MTRVARALLLLAMTCLAGACASSTTARSEPHHARTQRESTYRLPWAKFDVRVMSFNIRYGTADDGPNRWSSRRDVVFEVLDRHRPDVAGLQEALLFQLDEIEEALPTYDCVGVGRDDGREQGEFAAILYRTERLRADEHGTFWLSDTPDSPGSKSWGNSIPRICTWARFVERSSGRAFCVFNVHLSHHDQTSRERSVALLLERIATRAHAGEPIIVTGDFNAGEDNPAINAMRAAGFTDTLRRYDPHADDVGTFHGFEGDSSGGRRGEKIDYIFINPMITPLNAAILYDNLDGRYPSDHYPVFARVAW